MGEGAGEAEGLESVTMPDQRKDSTSQVDGRLPKCDALRHDLAKKICSLPSILEFDQLLKCPFLTAGSSIVTA